MINRLSKGYAVILVGLIGYMIGPSCAKMTVTEIPPDFYVDCHCRCVNFCTQEQVSFTDGGATCSGKDPRFGSLPGVPEYSTTRQICVGAATPPVVYINTCFDTCRADALFDALNPAKVSVPVKGNPGFPNAFTQFCSANLGDLVVGLPNTCTVVPTTSALTISTAQNGAEVAMTSQGSVAQLDLPGGEFGARNIIDLPPPSGTVSLRGGNCPGRSCAIGLDLVTLRVDAFSVPGTSLGDTAIVNNSSIPGTKAADGSLLFGAGGLDFTVSTTVNEELQASSVNGSTVPASMPLTGSYDPVSGRLQLAGSFSDGTGDSRQAISFSLVGQAVTRPPNVDAGPAQSASCRAGGPAVVRLDGSRTSDPDGHPLTLAWSENGVVLANTAIAFVSLKTGVHDLTLTAIDSSGRSGQDVVRVTVSDAVPPQFTFVPPTVVVDNPGVVSIGQALASDGCGAVTVTNNAPAAFPIGKTTVTWTATDTSGNRVTTTQLVYALPAIASSCPAGSHIILGTSNNDVLTGTEGPDCIIGFGGQDRIDGRGGDDMLLGGEGDDIIIGGTGNDIIVGGGGQDNLSGSAGNDILAGSSGDDTVSGGDGNDTLVGGTGQDHLNGDAGNDVLIGNEGDDVMNGGTGTDRCVADSGHDQLIFCE